MTGSTALPRSAAGVDSAVHPVPMPAVAIRRTGATKRIVDLVGGSALLVVLSPVLAVVGWLVRRDSPGPALYRGERLGQGRRTFTVYKFRSMTDNAPDDLHREYVLGLLSAGDSPAAGGADGEGPRFKLAADPRVTRVGRWLRRTTIDELPQLINVVRGEMSLVGPRPEVPYALEAYEPWHHERFSVKPGMTGLWQVSGRGDLSPKDMLALDVKYARTRSIPLDLKILLMTVPAVLRRRGAS